MRFEHRFYPSSDIILSPLTSVSSASFEIPCTSSSVASSICFHRILLSSLSFLATAPSILVPHSRPRLLVPSTLPSSTVAVVAPSSISGGGGAAAATAAGAIFCPRATLLLGISSRLRGIAAISLRNLNWRALSVVQKAPLSLSLLARPLKVAHFYSQRVETLYFRLLQPHPPKAAEGAGHGRQRQTGRRRLPCPRGLLRAALGGAVAVGAAKTIRHESRGI